MCAIPPNNNQFPLPPSFFEKKPPLPFPSSSSPLAELFAQIPLPKPKTQPLLSGLLTSPKPFPYPAYPPSLLTGLLQPIPVKRKIFVSYHHKNDQSYYDLFSKLFHDEYELIHDNSLDDEIDSENHDYIIQAIRENHITGTSCTIILCGNETPWRKYVDWETKSTLDKQHGLIGIILPTNIQDSAGKYRVPDRFFENVNSGYAVWDYWNSIATNPSYLSKLIETANVKPKKLIMNTAQRMARNGTRPLYL